eukprot:4594987-Pyramimonas_sp.AAC.1
MQKRMLGSLVFFVAVQRPSRPLGPPCLFSLIKSNCHAERGSLACAEPGHSHWRGIFTTSGAFFAAG